MANEERAGRNLNGISFEHHHNQGWTPTRQGRVGVYFLITKVAKTTPRRSKGAIMEYIEDDRRSGEGEY